MATTGVRRIAGWAVPAALALGLILQAPPARVAAQAEDALDVVKVDATAKTITVKADGRDQQFTFNEATKISGAQGPAGLATMEGSQVTVTYTTKDRVMTATEIRVSAKK